MPLPEYFTVGEIKTVPLVSVDEVTAHLRILGAFSALRAHVEHEGVNRMHIDGKDAWTVFLCRAVYRFQRCVQTLVALPREGAMPPLDVIMVWHTYMLNPLTYEEDSKRKVPQLGSLDMFPLIDIANLLDPESGTLQVSEDAQRLFEETTGQPFNMPIVTDDTEELDLVMPCCDNERTIRWRWITSAANGFAQRNFIIQCRLCGAVVNHEAFGVRKLCDEMVAWRDARVVDRVYYLAGTMRQNNRRNSSQLLEQFLKRLAEDDELKVLSGAGLPKKWEFKMQNVIKWCMEPYGSGRSGYKVVLTRITRIASYYRFPGAFSIELTAAVMRQASFVRKMAELRWTEWDRFIQNPSVLLRAISRYHAFLDCMAWNHGTCLVPTLDIDIAWHTHQLKAKHYRVDTQKLLRRTPDHDDAIEENVLSTAFDKTADIWMRRFGVPYSCCGCPVKAETVTSRTIRHVKAILPGKSQTPKNERPDLITYRWDGDEDATHPSEHNSVTIISSKGENLRKGRKWHLEDRLSNRRREVEKGTAGPWTILQERRATRPRSDGSTHSPAFFQPVPYWGVSQMPYGYYGMSGAACGSVGGSLAQPEREGQGESIGELPTDIAAFVMDNSSAGCGSNCGSGCSSCGGSGGCGSGGCGGGGCSS